MSRVRALGGRGGFVLAVALLAVPACGGKAPAPSTGPPDGGGPNAPPAGSGGGGGGGTGTGSGTPSGTSSGDGAGGTAAPSGSGTPGAGAGGSPGDAGGGGASAGGSPSGDSGGGAPAASACTGLVAAPDAGRILRLDTGTHTVCHRATSGPDGQLALGVRSDGVTFRLYPPDGSAQQGTIGAIMPESWDIDPWFHWTSAGWAGLVHEPPPPIALASFDGGGDVLGATADYAVSSAPDGHGGTVMLARSFTPDAPGDAFYGPTMLEWVDASGAPGRKVLLDADPAALLVDFATDHVLALVLGGSTLQARWYDGTGTPLTPWFDAGPGLSIAPSLHLLVDGTVALGDWSTWRGVLRDGVAGLDPPPAWLAARPATRLATIRQGRGYAVLPLPATPGTTSGQDQTSFEIVSASGEACGTVAIPEAPAEAGVTHAPVALDVGQDGTVIETEMLLGAQDVLGSGIHCDFRWWPALLR